MIRFANPEYFYALYLIPAFILLFWYLLKRRRNLLGQFADKNLLKIISAEYSSTKNLVKFVLFIIAYALLITAAANPQVGTKMEEVKQTGIDVYIALDVSLSMTAEDIKPNRLEKAKYEISNLIKRLRGDRIGLLIFSGQAYIQFPLTTDYSAANLFLSAVDVNSVPQPGTAIGAAISLAINSFDYKTATQKVIVIITDGEDHEGDLTQPIKDANEKEIKIYTIGLGSPEGVPIPIHDSNGNVAGFKKDGSGSIVLTKLDEQTLMKIASEAGGKFFKGTNYEDELDKIYKDLSSLDKAEFGTKKVTDYEDRFYYFLIPAVFLLIVEFFITDKKSPFFKKINRRLGLE
ncbi:MAG: VWA domain-containing protein [Ignavibacteriaceae bacterium]|nr:VWA domain-containing protein [Ignavibacteriaceae bacterium]